MLKEADITVLTAIGSTGFALALLGSVSALWPYTEDEVGRASFAFALVVVFVSVLGNLIFLATRMMEKKKKPDRSGNIITSILAVIVFVTGLITSVILFSEGLNSWFETAPVMPDSLILLARLMLGIPILWLLFSTFSMIYENLKK